jgi:prepilin-type N-terminal cleavage/methylation domain-containing protein
MSNSSQWSHSGSRARGFTLVELLVVMSIILILTSLFILNQQRFNSSTVLRTLAYSVALSVRQAQVYGTSVRENAPGAFDTNSAARGYGIYFSSASPTTYILFADSSTSVTPNNGTYDSGTDTIVQTYKLSSGYTINNFCVVNASNVSTCSPSISSMSILFRRPDPDSCFSTNTNPNICAINATPLYTSAYVQIKSNSDTRGVNVTLTGQISVGSLGS